jgi:hypothetical protein
MGALPTINDSQITPNLVKSGAPYDLSNGVGGPPSVRLSLPIEIYMWLRVDPHINNTANPYIELR